MPDSFTKFVLRFRHDDTAWGDVARDVSADPNVEDTWGWQRLRRHIENMKAVPVVLRILEEMHEAYLASLEAAVRARTAEWGC